jgi:hypothetical protein
MKKMKFITLVAALPLIMSSCVIYSSHWTTGNPIGTKTGESRTKLFSKTSDAGIGAAAKAGKITKIGSVDIKRTSFGSIIVTVTGE